MNNNSCFTEKIDNIDLIPKISPDSEVVVDKNGTPDWAELNNSEKCRAF